MLTSHAAPPRLEQWNKVDDAEMEGLPKTAIDQLDPIIKAALAEKAYPEAIKAIAKKIALQGEIDWRKPEEKIIRLKAAISAAPVEMQPVMNAILANWYWHFFENTRWKFGNRTVIGEAGDDFTTWDRADFGRSRQTIRQNTFR